MTTKNLPKSTTPADFSSRVLAWFYEHGRHDLPWQNLHAPFDPYPVWISEIMLQQTQVATVIGYYTRFMARFKTLFDLADAPLDEVIEHWAGLGYYARARNLHKTAQTLAHIVRTTGNYPTTLSEWQALSGIGQSTAGAILAMGLGQFGVICDGNVKRVLTRHFAIQDDIGKTKTDKALWELATALTPNDKSGHYAQAMMDMGATLCTRTKPNCPACPISTTCQAHQEGNPTAYPIKAKKAQKPTHHAYALRLIYQNQSLFIKRPESGIWGALWCLPLYNLTRENDDGETALYQLLQDDLASLSPTASIRHTLTHFHWQLERLDLVLDKTTKTAIDSLLTNHQTDFFWYDNNQLASLAKPTAIQKLLTPQ